MMCYVKGMLGMLCQGRLCYRNNDVEIVVQEFNVQQLNVQEEKLLIQG